MWKVISLAVCVVRRLRCVYVVYVGACRCVYMFTVMFQILFMAVVLYAPALAFEAGALNKCCDLHDVEERVNVGSV